MLLKTDDRGSDVFNDEDNKRGNILKLPIKATNGSYH